MGSHASHDQVESFLQDFKAKLSVFSVVYRDDKQKNTQALADLDIRPIERKDVLAQLTVADYSSGPTAESLYGNPDMWVFGKDIKGTEVYIKISMGHPGAPVLCLSFHEADHPLGHPLKGAKP
jgi:hypothetical protein